MIININSKVLNKYILKPSIQGLEKPEIRTASGNFSGRDGGWIASQFYKYRVITINGVLNEETCANLETSRQELMAALPIRTALPMFITTFAGAIYYADVYVIDLKMDIVGAKFQEFQLTVMSPDPYLYDAGDGTDPDSGFITQTIYKLVGGGYIFPYILPVIWEAGSTPTLVNNTSDVLIFPIITLTDTFTNPRIQNNTTGQYIELAVTTTTGDEIIIDMKNRTVTLNGGSILPYKSGNWWGLIAGANMIELTSDGGGDNTEGTIKYRIAYEGI